MNEIEPFCQFYRKPHWQSLSKYQKGHISAIWPQIKKIRTLYFLKLWKLEKIKWSYFLDLRPNEWDRAILSILKKAPIGQSVSKLQNGHISVIWPQIKKNKGTLSSPTFKVGENKVVLFSWFEAKWMRYGNMSKFGPKLHHGVKNDIVGGIN